MDTVGRTLVMEAGVTSMRDIDDLSLEELVSCGIPKAAAAKIKAL